MTSDVSVKYFRNISFMTVFYFKYFKGQKNIKNTIFFILLNTLKY